MIHEFPKLCPDDIPPLTLKDFDTPATAVEADKHAKDIYRAVGVALSHWATVEDDMATLFAAVLQTRSVAAHRALFAVISHRGRIEVIRAAAEVALRPHREILSDVTERLKILSKAGARRNEIAHGRVTDYSENGRKIGCVLIPSLFDPRKMKESSGGYVYRYNTEIITGFATKFRILHAQLFDFVRGLEKLLPAFRPTP